MGHNYILLLHVTIWPKAPGGGGGGRARFLPQLGTIFASPSKSEVKVCTIEVVPMSFEAVTDTLKGKHTSGMGSEVTLRHRGPLVL